MSSRGTVSVEIESENHRRDFDNVLKSVGNMIQAGHKVYYRDEKRVAGICLELFVFVTVVCFTNGMCWNLSVLNAGSISRTDFHNRTCKLENIKCFGLMDTRVIRQLTKKQILKGCHIRALNLKEIHKKSVLCFQVVRR